MTGALEIENLIVKRDGKKILQGVDLKIEAGEVVALMGPNGSGKSTLASALMGHPECEISTGKILLDQEDITHASADRRAGAGLFLSMQSPPEIPGLTLRSFLRQAYNQIHEESLNPREFRDLLKDKAAMLNLNQDLLSRGLNEGFSGGERKKSEILQMMVLAPKYAILDETDSGLDVDALKVVGQGIETARGAAEQGMGILVITHHVRLLDFLRPDRVAVMKEGKIVKRGGPELAQEIEKRGYSD